MSTREKRDAKLPPELPKCDCFSQEDAFTWGRCANFANAGNRMCGAFHELVGQNAVCPTAMPFLLDVAIVCIMGYVAKAQGPALQYGSKEIEWEIERLLGGMEARLLARVKFMYAEGRELGLTEETVRAMRERDSNEGGIQ